MSTKQCGLCQFKTNNAEAFASHMLSTHGWGSGQPQRSSALGRVGKAVGVIVLGLIALAIVTPGKSAPTSTGQIQGGVQAPATAAPATPAPHIGSVIEAGNWRYSVRQVDSSKTYKTGSGFLTSTYTAKGIWVIVLIQLTNIGKQNFSINYFDFELRDDKGIKYNPEPSYSFDLPPGYMNFGEQTPPGVPLLATLYFDVAPGTSGPYLYITNVGLLEKAPVIYLY